TEADAAPVLTQVLDREPEPSRPGWTKHQPICALWKKLFGQRLAEHFVVNAKVFKLEPALWNPGCAAGLKREHGFARQSLWEPPTNGTAAQPFVLKRRKSSKVIERLDLASRVPTEPVRKTK